MREGGILAKKPEDRLCGQCNLVENEIQFLCQCTEYESLRKIMYDSINDTNVKISVGPNTTFFDLMTILRNKHFKKLLGNLYKIVQ